MVGLLCGSLCGACLLATAAGDKLGPGDGAWEREAPELHGLDSRKLDEAARLLDREVPQRYCFAVARNGKLVYEAYNEKDVRYPGQKNTENTRYEVDSAGKTMQAMMVGVGVTKKLYDLDTPIEKYGVKPQASFGPIWNREEFYHDLTLRHILSQTTGQGKAKPGTAFTYDSDACETGPTPSKIHRGHIHVLYGGHIYMYAPPYLPGGMRVV
jgi:CubicO group peptidase (beta-lactamase class C family)